jgi:hypothetical protein
MIEPKRITSRARSKRNDPGAEMLRAARSDAPTPRSRERAAAALGLAVGAGVAGSTTTTAAAASGGAKLGALGGAAIAVKWVAIGTLGAAIAVGAAMYVRAPVAPRQATEVSPAASAPIPRVVPPVTRNLATAPEAPSSARKDVRTTPPASASNVAPHASGRSVDGPASMSAPPILASSATRPTSSALDDELRLLDVARTDLAAGDARGALDALDAHDRTFKSGPLAPEAAVLRIEALAQSGDDDAATARANEFLSAFPDSPQERRVRSILEIVSARQKP